jgi:hypothetical protein
MDGYHLTNNIWWRLTLNQSQSYVATEGQSASLSWCQAPSGAQDQIAVTVRQLRVCWEYESIVYNCCWSSPEQSFSGSSPGPRDPWSYFTVSDSGLPQTGGSGSVFISPRNRVGQLYPGTGFPFRRLRRIAGLRRPYSNPPPHAHQSQSLSYFATGGLPPISLCWCQAPSDPQPDFFLSTGPLR